MSSTSPSLFSSCLIVFRGFEGDSPSLPGSTMVSASESRSGFAPSSCLTLGSLAADVGVGRGGGDLSGLEVEVGFTAVLGSPGSLGARLGEAGCFVLAAPAACCTSISFNSNAELQRRTPSWPIAGDD